MREPGTVPTYTYTCTACNDVVEKRQSFTDPPLTTCEQCGGTLRKIIHPVGIVFKGSGWYITDSRSSSSSTKAPTSSTSSDSSTGKESASSTGKESASSAGKESSSSTSKESASSAGKESSSTSSGGAGSDKS
jgi:putative FmdB family regulatory protein